MPEPNQLCGEIHNPPSVGPRCGPRKALLRLNQPHAVTDISVKARLLPAMGRRRAIFHAEMAFLKTMLVSDTGDAAMRLN